MAKGKTVSPEVENLVSPEAEEKTEKVTEETSQVLDDGATETNEEAMEKPKDDGKVDYVVPMNVFGDGDYVTVGLNGVNYQIEAGVQIRIPKGVAVILDEAIRRKKLASGKAKKLIEKLNN